MKKYGRPERFKEYRQAAALMGKCTRCYRRRPKPQAKTCSRCVEQVQARQERRAMEAGK